MGRKPTGSIVELDRERGTVLALRFRANGKRQYVTLGTVEEGWTRTAAEEELSKVLAAVKLGVWRPPSATPDPPDDGMSFHRFASEWLVQRKLEGLRPRTLEDYEWALSYHLLPYFKDFQLSAITARDVDQYKAKKAAEGKLSPAIINKTLVRLSQVLGAAADYGLIPANPATGRKRRLKAPRRQVSWIEPHQLPAFLDGAKDLLRKRGRPLVAVLGGAGLRVEEALALRRRDVNLARGTLDVAQAKTHAGVRTVDLTPAVRDELAVYMADVPDDPDALVFGTSTGKTDNRNNVRRRLIVKAAERANVQLAKQGIEAIGKVSPHSLRRTYASLRCAVGDDPAYISAQLGHESPEFTLRVYAQAVKRRERLTLAERKAYDESVRWAEWAFSGTAEEEAGRSVAGRENV